MPWLFGWIPTFLGELERFGAFEFGAVSTAATARRSARCRKGGELSPTADSLRPVGMRDRLAASREVWLCYYCGECSETCPRQAEPGEFMASARRYFISTWDLTTLSPGSYPPGRLRRSSWESWQFYSQECS